MMLVLWLPIAAALIYPWILQLFHSSIAAGGVTAPVWLAAAFLLPLSGLAAAAFAPVGPTARRTGFAALAAPPLFVLTGVVSSLLHASWPDWAIWILAWLAIGVAASLVKPAAAPRGGAELGRLRVIHGVVAAVILLYVAFHLSNHLLGLLGPELHGKVMKAGRLVYRSGLVEPVLVALMLFQVAVGLRLAWRWSDGAERDPPRMLQVGSGVYLAAFILTHMNSAFVSARAVHHIETDWAWASGAPTGLLLDEWNIRLLPHYALGVFFIVAHLFCGLRVVLLAHRVPPAWAGRIWIGGLVLGALLSAAISCALCGVRV